MATMMMMMLGESNWRILRLSFLIIFIAQPAMARSVDDKLSTAG